MRVSKAKSGAPKKAAKAAGGGRQNRDLFERLRALRRKTAEEMGVPPYVVFADSALWGMCAALPKNRDELLEISGIGERKAERYGKMFLEEIGDYLKTRT